MCWSCTPKGVGYSVTPQICVLQHPFCLHSTLGLFVLWIHWLSLLHCFTTSTSKEYYNINFRVICVTPHRNSCLHNTSVINTSKRVTTASFFGCSKWHLIGLVAPITPLLYQHLKWVTTASYFRVLCMTPHRISCLHNTLVILTPRKGHHSILF